MKTTIPQMLECATREAGFRRTVYPERCRHGKMKPEKAAIELERMDAIILLLRTIRDTPALAAAVEAAGIPVTEAQMRLPL